jgi:hypothetical protein
LAGSIPLLAAIILLGLGEEADQPVFRLLVAALIVLGMIGAHVASSVTRGLSQVVVALTGTKA